jgi:putative membrane protein
VAVIRRASLIVVAASLCTTAFGHGLTSQETAKPSLWASWELDPLVIAGLLLSAILYSRGLYLLWGSTSVGSGIRQWQAAAFAAGWLSCVIALVSPLHPLGQALFSAHMTQHELLMLVAAPLMVLGQPMVVFLWAFSRAQARALSGFCQSAWIQQPWQLLSNAFVAWLIHLAALWVWHIPALFQATLESDLVHALQHISFLFSALLFWWAALHGRQRALGYGLAVVYMFATALQSGLLGVLLTVSTRIWYPAYADRATAWGLTPLEDQQLGGLIMWIPAGVVYIIAGLALMAGWLRESDMRSSKHEALKGFAG